MSVTNEIHIQLKWLMHMSSHREADQWAAEQRKQVHDAVPATTTVARVQRPGPQAATQKVSISITHKS